MRDQRVTKLKEHFQSRYQGKYGRKHVWATKQQVQIKTILKYADQCYERADEALRETRKAFDNYFRQKSDTMHDLGWFTAKPHIWFIEDTGKKDLPRTIDFAGDKYCYDESKKKYFYQGVESTFEHEPEVLLRGFRSTHRVMKRLNPKLDQRLIEFFKDKFGAEKSRQVFLGAKKLDIPLNAVK